MAKSTEDRWESGSSQEHCSSKRYVYWNEDSTLHIGSAALRMHSTAHDVEIREGAGHYLSSGWEGGEGEGNWRILTVSRQNLPYPSPPERRLGSVIFLWPSPHWQSIFYSPLSILCRRQLIPPPFSLKNHVVSQNLPTPPAINNEWSLIITKS